MDIEVSGNRNSVAGRDIIQVALDDKKEPITANQRRRLNALVAEVSDDLKVEAKTLWTDVVHVRLGVQTVGEITRDQFLQAEQALYDYRQQQLDTSSNNRLISEILRQSKLKGIAKPMSDYCLHTAGVSKLKRLDRDKLLQVLRFVESYQVTPEQEPPESVAAEVITPTKQSFMTDLKVFLTTYPMHCGAIALVLVVLGRLA
ncbi:hypothetical protein D9M71_116220 [compost metagenome]